VRLLWLFYGIELAMKKFLLFTFFILSLIGCLELEGVKLSRDDLVQPRGIEGRWIVKYFGSKESEKIAQIRAAADGTLEVSQIDAKGESEKLEHWLISLISTSSGEMFIALIRSQGQKDNKMILGALFKAQKAPQEATQNRMDWVLYLYDIEKGVPVDEVAQWLKDRYGVRYRKTDYGAAIQGTINARTLREMSGDPNWTKYFKAEPHAGMTPLPKNHLYHARLDKALANSAQRVSTEDAKRNETTASRRHSGPSEMKNCGSRRCATLNGRIIYRSRVSSPHWWYWPDGEVVPPKDWPNE
jgi:hypothetical protein